MINKIKEETKEEIEEIKRNFSYENDKLNEKW